MNFLLIQSAGEHPENAEFRECLCLARGLEALGHWVMVMHKDIVLQYRPGKDLRSRFYDHIDTPGTLDWADAIVTLEQYPDKADWMPDLASVKKPKLLWVIDEHCRGWDPYAREAKRGRYDILLHATLMAEELSTSLIAGYEAAAPWLTHKWFPNAYDDTLIGPRDVENVAPWGFVGNRLASAERSDFIERLTSTMQGADHSWVISHLRLGEGMVKAINGLKVHWNMNIADDINYRCFETIGCGVPLVTNSRGPAHDEQYKRLGFVSGFNCFIYRSYDDCVERIRLLLDYDGRRQTVAANGLKLAARHTYKERAKQLVEIVEGL